VGTTNFGTIGKYEQNVLVKKADCFANSPETFLLPVCWLKVSSHPDGNH